MWVIERTPLCASIKLNLIQYQSLKHRVSYFLGTKTEESSVTKKIPYPPIPNPPHSRKGDFIHEKNSSTKCSLLVSAVIWLALTAWQPPAFADNAVKLRILLITTGDVRRLGFAYIKPVLDEMGVPYDVLNAKTQDLTAAMLASSSAGVACKADDAGCVGNYNGIILTDRRPGSQLHAIGMGHTARLPEKLRRPPGGAVRMASHLLDPNLLTEFTWIMVLSFPPAETTTRPSGQCDYTYSKQVFEYVNLANPFQLRILPLRPILEMMPRPAGRYRAER